MAATTLTRLPAGTPELERSRYPALGELRPRLAPGAMVICDDALRPGQRWALERWRSELEFAYELDEADGIAHGALEGWRSGVFSRA